ncbi:aspartate aminotransferase family protein, partial [Pseudomonas aeruginosa]
YLVNRCIRLTPFHDMTLCCPDTPVEDVGRLLSRLDEAHGELLAVPGARDA